MGLGQLLVYRVSNLKKGWGAEENQDKLDPSGVLSRHFYQ
jgi:hypothetical protein